MSYILYDNGVLENDGTFTPPNDEDYQAWLALGNTPEIRPASEYLTKLEDNRLSRAQLKAEYLDTINTLLTIENTASPTNAQVIAAVKFLAKTVRLIIKLLARMV